MNHDEMMKSISALIDETLAEVEELKKSDRFSASEIKIEGPGTGIAGKPVNGSLDKDEDKDDDDEDEDEDKDDDDKDMDKAEGTLRQADPNGGNHKIVKSDLEKAKEAMDKAEADMSAAKAAMEKAEGQNRQADPNGSRHAVVKTDDEDEDDKKKDKKDKDKDDGKMAFMKKSVEQSNTLMKSYVDQRLAPIESKLESILNLVKQVSEAPAAPAKGVSYRGVAPLLKSQDEGEPLTKSVIVDKLFELQKSGAKVNVTDITSAELASPAELAKIANKYNIK